MLPTYEELSEILEIELFKWKKVPRHHPGICTSLNFFGDNYISENFPGVSLNVNYFRNQQGNPSVIAEIEIFIRDNCYGDIEDFVEWAYQQRHRFNGDNMYFHLDVITKYAKTLYTGLDAFD